MSVEADDRLSRSALDLPVAYRQPAPGLESLIAGAYAAVFGIAGVGGDDDFYDLGGDSLLGETLSMEILARTGKDFQVSWFYEHGTPAKVAKRLAAGGQQGARPPIFLVHGRGGYSSPGPKFRAGLAPDQRVEVFEVPGLRGNGPTSDSVEELARIYVGRLLAGHAEGPVLLGAFCSGALIALEMARQLEAIGRPVHHLVLIDPGAPRNLYQRHWREMAARGIAVSKPAKLLGRRRRLREAAWRALTAVALGRITDLSQERDFADGRLRRLNSRWNTWLERTRRMGSRSAQAARRRAGDGYSPVAQGKLLSAFQLYWPQLYLGSVDVICSQERSRVSLQDGEFWASLLPRREVLLRGATHREAVGMDSLERGADLQRLFDASLASRPADAGV